MCTSSHFAVFSSLTIILALGFDPFSQNLVRYHQGSINDTAQRAFMGNTSLYNAYGGPFHNDGTWRRCCTRTVAD
jgi:hypothetical protein